VDEDGRYYPDFPVPRFLCHRKGTAPVVDHSTFSLLHYHLVPYEKYSIPFIIKVLKAKHIKGLTLKLLQDYIADFSDTGTEDEDENENGCDGYIELSTSRIYSFQGLIQETITKLLISQYYHELTIRLHKCSGSGEKGSINVFLEFSTAFECQKVSIPIRGPCALSYDFYLEGGSHFRNSHFLFGTPSQFRL
jgi:hypothetical protein